MGSQPRGRRIVIRAGAGLLTVVLGVAAAGPIYQWWATRRDLQAHRPHGKLVDVGGHGMHLDCTGEGSPTVILEAGLGDASVIWHKVQPLIAGFTRVCSYDRAGMGWSEPSPNGRTAKDIAGELTTLLSKAGIRGPYVVVGHSLGGFDALLFYCLAPEQVAGLVLVDSSHPEQKKRLPAEARRAMAERLEAVQKAARLAPWGISRLRGWCGEGPADLLPITQAIGCTSSALRETYEELRVFDESALQVRTMAPPANVPLVVLSRDPDLPQPSSFSFIEVWDQMQRDLTQLSRYSSRIVANGSGHYIQLDRPDVVVEAVRKVVTWAGR